MYVYTGIAGDVRAHNIFASKSCKYTRTHQVLSYVLRKQLRTYCALRSLQDVVCYERYLVSFAYINACVNVHHYVWYGLHLSAIPRKWGLHKNKKSKNVVNTQHVHHGSTLNVLYEIRIQYRMYTIVVCVPFMSMFNPG